MSNHGGARNRSGPTKDPNSAKSESLGIKFVNLPPAGHKGRAPKWPLDGPTERERVVWREVWKTPQAEQWAKEKLWRLRPVALYVRWSVRAEEPECSASILTQVNRLADQLGLTPAGLAFNGWKIAAVSAVPNVVDEPSKAPAEMAPRRPLVMMDGGA
ncbi:hypothetical protein [Rhodococcoides fascians]|uniref:hypothetical protein n=1 Tax=Rhodococcoides fascians TaxID=1828 RepID=UPI000691083F|nr:hypothetical protein [Rhodococcus fascians]